MATQSLKAEIVAPAQPEKKGLFAYRALLLFSVLYFARPEDVIPGLGKIPLAKVTGGIAVLALIVGLGSRSVTRRFPIELRLLTGLFIWECLSIPFAWYHMGALNTVLGSCSKTLIVAVLISLVVNRIDQLRRLMWVQAAAVALMTFVSVVGYRGGRMGGVLGGVFDNPNDLAVNIGLNWPLCIMFMLRTRSVFKKLLWAVGLVFLLRGLMLTYSRTGFLALGVATIFCLVEFGLRGKRYHLIAIALAGVLVAAFFAPAGYSERMGSIIGHPLQVGDSQFQRRQLLDLSLQVTAQHPLLGIGASNFEGYTQMWRVTHNTYTQLSAECGIPALILFILFLRAAFKNLKRVRKSQLFTESVDARFITGGLWASLAGYVVGAFFASTAYHLFPYFLVVYTTALFNIASPSGRQPAIESSPLQTWKPNPQFVKATTS